MENLSSNASIMLENAAMYNWAFFILSVLVMIYFGMRGRKVTERSDDGFLVAGRSLGPVVGTCAVVGTGYSGWCFMGAPGICYAFGPIELLYNFGFAVSITLAVMFFAGVLRRSAGAMGSNTIPEYIAHSHAHGKSMTWMLQGAAGFITLILLIVFLVGQIRAVGLLTAQWLDIAPWLASTIVISMIVFYTAFGGLAAVAWTDTVMVIGMVMACVYCSFVIFSDVSPMELITQLRANFDGFIDVQTAAPYGDSKISAYYSIPYAFFFAAVLPYMAVRFLAFKKDANLPLMGFYTAVLCIVLSIIPVVGLYVKLRVPELEVADNAMPVFLANFVHPAANIVITLFILFAMQSTANGLLHTLSSAATHDMRVALTKDAPISAARALRLNRIGVLVIGLAGIFLTYVAPSHYLNFLNILGTGTLQAVLIGPVFIGTFWRGNAYGALASMIGGGLTAGYCLLATDLGWVMGPLLGDIVACTLYVAVSLATMKVYSPIKIVREATA